MTIAKFTLGQMAITPAAQEALTKGEIVNALVRHQLGDWGEVDDHDKMVNNHALACGERLFSGYDTEKGVRFWIITEADRSSTTILLPSDY